MEASSSNIFALLLKKIASQGQDNLSILCLTIVVIAGTAVPYFVYKSVSLYINGGNARKDRPWKLIPGWLPLLGHFYQVGSLDNLDHATSSWNDEYGQEHGCYDVDLAGQRYTVICRQDRALEILKNRPAIVERSTVIREVVDAVGARGVFSAEGQQWRNEHKLVAAALSRSNVQDYLEVFRDMAERVVEKWSACCEQETLIVDNDLAHFSADTIAKVTMNRDFDFLNQPDSQLFKDVQNTVNGSFRRALSPVWYWRIPVIGQHLDGIGTSALRVHKLLTEIVRG